MAALNEQDFVSVADEKFDFDISLSPASSKGDEDEDEVFVGPIRHKERCIAVGVEARVKDGLSSSPSQREEPSFPLTLGNFEEISKEAQLVVTYLDSSLHGSSSSQNICIKEAEFTPAADKFKAENVAKPRLSPIKRETFCIQDSPLKQLPPAIQQRLMKAKGSAKTAAATSKPRQSTSSPIRQPGAQPQPKMTLRSKAGLTGPRSVLPSKPTVPAVTQTPVKMRPAPPDKNKLQPPNRGNAGSRRSISCRTSTRMGSTEDLLSDSASVNSDVSDTSLNSSLTGKRNIPPPCKPVLRRQSTVKAPVIQTHRVVDRRRNTSSSSSSVSSINSSITVSPMPKAKLNSSLNSSGLSAPAGPAVAATTAAKSRRSSVMSRAPEPAPAGRRSISVQSCKLSEPLARPVKSTPCRKPNPTPVPTQRQTPTRRSIAPSSSVQATNKAESTVKANSRLTGQVGATPTNPSKGVSRPAGFTTPDGRIMKPKRLLSACSMESLTEKCGHPAGLHTPPAVRDKLMPAAKMRRLSALPTPSARRFSSAPLETPRSCAKPATFRKACAKSPSQMGEVPVEPLEAKEAEDLSRSMEPAATDTSESRALIFSLDTEAESEIAPPTAPEPPEPLNKPVEPLLVNIGPLSVPEVKKTNDQTQLDLTKGQNITEVLLMDLPAPELTPDEKPLIDLSNTPDLIRTASVKSSGEQLIDLSSPLIKWSPDDKKENVKEVPLIDLSF